MKILHFATWKCPISGPILVLMFEYMIGGLHGPLLKKILHYWAKGAKFQALFSLNDFWVMQGSNPLASN